MFPEFARGTGFWDLVIGAGVLLGALDLALLAHPILTRVAKAMAGRTKTTLDDLVVEAVAKPIFLFIIVHGIFFALTVTTFLDPWQAYVNRVWLASMLAVIVIGVQRVANALIRWYGQDVAVRTRSRLDEKMLPFLRRLLTALIYVVGALIILDNLGVRLSPLLASLGLGGLAVALALQPTLSSFFAGAYMAADATIGAGDFIEVQGGPSGTVMDIGWRTTKVQTPEGNLAIIPNSKLVDSIVTNYQSPTPEMNVAVECGVSYESDLGRVEKVCLEVAQETIGALPEVAVEKEFQPVVRFRAFGDSNVNFIVVLRAKDRSSSFLLTHEFIKRLHARFAREGLEINYPVRKLVYAPQEGQPLPAAGKGVHQPRAG